MQIRKKIWVMGVLLAVCTGLTYYCPCVLQIETLFTHFFYIPIILASIWWKRIGVVVAIFLALLLIFSHVLAFGFIDIDNLMQATFFIVVSLVVIILSEQIATAEDYAENLEDVIHVRGNDLKKSEEKYRSLMNNVKLGVFRSTPGPTGKFLEVNPAMEEITGYSREKLLQMKVSNLYANPEEREKVLEEMALALASASAAGKTIKELKFRKKDGTEIVVWDTRFAVRDDAGRVKYFDGITEDITERKKIEEALWESEEKYRTTFEHTGTAMWVVEEDGTISVVNKEFEALSGYSKAEIEGKKEWHAFVADEDLERVAEYRRMILEGEEEAPVQYESRIVDKKGNVKDALIRRGIIPGTKKIVGSLIDITEKKRLDEMKSNFINIATHELRTPLTVITGYISILKGELNNLAADDKKEMLTIVERNALQLNQIISGMSSLSRMDSGELNLEKEVFSISELLKDVVADMKGLASEKAQDISLDIKGETKIEIEADKEAMRRIFTNLISNGIKFTPEGGKIGITLEEQGGENATGGEDEVLVSVSDTGIGIPDVEKERIFERFYQVGSSLARGQEGTGLGLSIVKGLVELHGGKVWVEDNPGPEGGSIFGVRIPK
jgi:PAS domain S-box-containing protein